MTPTIRLQLGRHLRGGFLAGWTVVVLLFLLVPLAVPLVLSFSSERVFVFPPSGLSWRWYAELFAEERWRSSILNSFIVGLGSTFLATVLGTMGALGLHSPAFPARNVVRGLILSPIMTPFIITAVGSYMVAAKVGLLNTYAALIIAHTVLGAPFVVVAVTASLSGFDSNLVRAAQSCGATPSVAFRRVTLPLILPGVLSGAALAFATTFDEVVIAQFLTGAGQRTLPLQMFTSLREQLSPALTAAATLMMVLSLVLLGISQILRRKSEARLVRTDA